MRDFPSCSLIAACLLSGCGMWVEPVGVVNHGYGYEYDAISAHGLKLRYTPLLAANDPRANASLYQRAYDAVELCTLLSAPPPMTIIVQHGTVKNEFGDPVYGQYEMPTPADPAPLILVTYTDWLLWAFMHESIHHLLLVNTGDADHDHASAFFMTCADQLYYTIPYF